MNITTINHKGYNIEIYYNPRLSNTFSINGYMGFCPIILSTYNKGDDINIGTNPKLYKDKDYDMMIEDYKKYEDK